MYRSIILLFLVTFLEITSGQAVNSTSIAFLSADVNGTLVKKNNTLLLEYIHNIYDSIVDLSNDFSRFPLSDEYDPVKVSIFLPLQTCPCNIKYFTEL